MDFRRARVLGFLVIARFCAVSLTTFSTRKMALLTAKVEGGVTATCPEHKSILQTVESLLNLHMLPIVTSAVWAEANCKSGSVSRECIRYAYES